MFRSMCQMSSNRPPSLIPAASTTARDSFTVARFVNGRISIPTRKPRLTTSALSAAEALGHPVDIQFLGLEITGNLEVVSSDRLSGFEKAGANAIGLGAALSVGEPVRQDLDLDVDETVPLENAAEFRIADGVARCDQVIVDQVGTGIA